MLTDYTWTLPHKWLSTPKPTAHLHDYRKGTETYCNDKVSLLLENSIFNKNVTKYQKKPVDSLKQNNPHRHCP